MRVFKVIFLNYVVLAMLLAAGCRVRSAVESKTTIKRDVEISELKTKSEVSNSKDSSFVREKEIVTDTNFTAPSASVDVVISNPCPEFKEQFKNYSKSFKQAGISFRFSGDSLIIKCNCDSINFTGKNRVKLFQQFHQRYNEQTNAEKHEKTAQSSIQSTSEVSKTIRVLYFPTWLKTLLFIGLMSTIALIIIIYNKFKNRKNEQVQ